MGHTRPQFAECCCLQYAAYMQPFISKILPSVANMQRNVQCFISSLKCAKCWKCSLSSLLSAHSARTCSLGPFAAFYIAHRVDLRPQLENVFWQGTLSLGHKTSLYSFHIFGGVVKTSFRKSHLVRSWCHLGWSPCNNDKTWHSHKREFVDILIIFKSKKVQNSFHFQTTMPD